MGNAGHLVQPVGISVDTQSASSQQILVTSEGSTPQISPEMSKIRNGERSSGSDDSGIKRRLCGSQISDIGLTFNSLSATLR